jgi:DNA-binding transcriptional ArsR family regulator
MGSRPLRHPEMDRVTVADLLHALADPTRLAIVSELSRCESGLNCAETIGRVGVLLPRSTCSQHYQILRESGLIRSERRGVELTSHLRRQELSARFPGLLDAILVSYHQVNPPT